MSKIQALVVAVLFGLGQLLAGAASAESVWDGASRLLEGASGCAACGDPGCTGCGEFGGCASCGDGSSCGCGGLLGGLIKPSDACFDDFISPMTNFVFFEDPRTLTEARPIFVNHWVPGTIGSGATAGGTIQLYALHLRAALSERLSVIAVKDGFIVDHTGGDLDTLLDDGWAAVTAGLKYNLVRDVANGRLISGGVTYELPIGSQRAFQDVGDGEFHLFLSGGQRFLDGDAHWLSSVGYRLPADSSAQTTSLHFSNHFDVRVTERAYLFTEFIWWHWTDSASNGIGLGVGGQDLFNLPANDVTGNDLLTQSVGVKLKPSRKSEVGFAYEFPLTGFQDVLESRITVDYILRF